jgi:hypothetical protein
MKIDLFGPIRVPEGYEYDAIGRKRIKFGEPLQWFLEHINDETDECII